MSKYENDPRVWRRSDGTWHVEAWGEEGVPGSRDGNVRELPSGRFEAWLATPTIDYWEYATFDEAVYSLIGDPK